MAPKYTVSDYEAVATVVRSFKHKLVTTPHVLAEVSNLANKLSRARRDDFYRAFAELIEALDEIPVTSAEACRLSNFEVYGLTDLGILKYCLNANLVFTDDNRLSYHLQDNGVGVLTLDEVRALGPR
jgi:rRNA-processing protein FCF1